MPTLEFFYDIGSPWTYLAFHKIEVVAAETGAELIWKPILVGGVFNAVNPGVYEARANPTPARWAYMAKDMADWTRLYGLKIVWPPSVFPVNSVKAMRGALVALDEGCISAYSRAVFEAYWGDDRDISQPEVIAGVAKSVGLDDADFLKRIASDEIKSRLRANVDELIEREDMYFGNDRLDLMRAALGG
jgi:2-hydroxychromene-2-carboxylate isomerase